MRLSDYLFGIAEGIKKYYNDLKFPEDDIRKDFHGMIYDLVNNYYYGHVSFELSNKISDGKVLFLEEMHEHKTHIDRLTEVNKIATLSSSFIASLNKQLIIGSWTSFELSITTIADVILTETEKDSLM